jgi:lipid-A-disaccharide synthase
MKLYVVAGEESGDARGVELMAAVRARSPEVAFVGAGGKAMKAFAGNHIFDWADEAVVGVWDVLKKYGYFKKQLNRMLAEIEREKPDALVTIDYPGFNLRLAKAAKARIPNLRCIHYISPQVWAWKQDRIPKMAKFLDLMLCLFPFEVPLYEGVGLKAICIGHPLLDTLAAKRIDTARDPMLTALLPGSRSKEIRRIFPVMLDAAVHLRSSRQRMRFEASAASEPLKEEMLKIMHSKGCDDSLCPITVGNSHELMQRAGSGMVCSGTATLEATYFALPMVILYKTAWLTYAIGKRVIRIPFIGLPNVLANAMVAPEFIQYEAEPHLIANELLQLSEHQGTREMQQRAFAQVIESLGERGAAKRAANALLDHLRL